MCSEFFDKLFSSHRYENRSNLHESISVDIYKLMTNNTNTSNSLDSESEKMIDLISTESLEEEDDDDDDAMFEDLSTRCACGTELLEGWQCIKCRINCSGCNRALTKDPEDYCTRCNIKCPIHGLFKSSIYNNCPQC